MLYPLSCRQRWLAVAGWLWVTMAIGAGEPYLAFLNALRDRGYADMALEYCEHISSRTDTPRDIREVLDLELSACYRILAEQTQDSQLAQHHLAAARRLWENFDAAHPGHPAGATALIQWGDVDFEQGRRRMSRSERMKDPSLQSTARSEARQAFLKAKPQFAQAVERLKQQLAALKISTAMPRQETAGSPPPADDAVAACELNYLEARFKLAGADYYLAETYDKADQNEREPLLRAAREGFDWVYQRCQQPENRLRAQLWQGRAAEAVGVADEALELYEEVLLNEADSSGRPDELAAFFGQAALWKIQLLSAHRGPDVSEQAASEWLRAHESWRQQPIYSGVALQAAKGLLWRAEKESPARRPQLRQQAIAHLADLIARPNEFREEAIELIRERSLDVPAAAAAGGEVHLALGDSAAGQQQWSAAIAEYQAAIDAAASSHEGQLRLQAQRRLDHANYRLATSHYAAGRMDEAIQAAGKVARGGADQPYAAAAASLACFAGLKKVKSSSAADQLQAIERLQRIADFARQTWTGQPPADDALIVLGELALQRGDVSAALANFGQIAANSPRYPRAALAAAQLHWTTYLAEKKKESNQRNDQLLAEGRQRTEETLRAALNGSARLGLDSGTDDSAECALFLAEVCLEAERWKDGLELVVPLIGSEQGKRTAIVSASVLRRAQLIALRAWLSLGELEPAGKTALLLSQSAPDSSVTNSVLMEYVRRLRAESDPLRAKLASANSAQEPFAGAEAQSRLADHDKQLRALVEGLLPRKQFSLPASALLADTCAILDLTQPAREIYEHILQSDDVGAGAPTANSQLISRIRYQMVDLYRREGNYAQAASQADALIASHPNTLEFLMQKGRVLQEWAQHDSNLWPSAISHWTNTRLRLSKAAPRPAEYYQVVLNAAYCLLEQSKASGDPALSNQAVKLLKTILALDPDVNGTDMANQYRALLAKAQSAGTKTKASEPKKALP